MAQAAKDAGTYGVQVARDGLAGANPPIVDKIKEMGVEVVSLTDAERQAFVDATRPVYDAWKDKIGAELVDQAEKSVADRKQ